MNLSLWHYKITKVVSTDIWKENNLNSLISKSQILQSANLQSTLVPLSLILEALHIPKKKLYSFKSDQLIWVNRNQRIVQLLPFTQGVYKYGIYLIFNSIPVTCAQCENSCSWMILQPCNCRNSDP